LDTIGKNVYKINIIKIKKGNVKNNKYNEVDALIISAVVELIIIF